MPTLLEIIANSRAQIRNTKNKNYTDNDPYSTYSPYTADKDKFKRLEEKEFYDLSPNPSVVEIGLERLQDLINLNLTQPNFYDLVNLDNFDVANIAGKPLLETGSEQYASNILYNQYYSGNIDLIEISNPTNFTGIRYDNYSDYISRILQNCRYRSTLSIYTNTDNLEDSTIGNIGADELRRGLAVNFDDNIKNLTLGRIDTSLSAILSGNLIVRDFEITVNPNPLGRTFEIISRIGGLTIPFQRTDDVLNINGGNENSLEEQYRLSFERTGKAYRSIIKNNFDINTYKPLIESDGYNVVPNYYIFYNSINETFDTSSFNAQYLDTDELVPFGSSNSTGIFSSKYGLSIIRKDLKTINENLITTSNFLNIDDEDKNDWEIADWSKDSVNRFDKKSLLWKTKELTINNSDVLFIDNFSKEFLLKQNGEEAMLSKGSTITAKGTFTMDDSSSTVIEKNEYFRAFTKDFKYNQLARALRHRTLDNGEQRTVLGENGIPHYMPTSNDNEELFKRSMFSIENLAWKHNIADLPLCERGNPDLNGNIGRFMPFPPYSLRFSESSTVNFTEHEFIGRGESVYSYNNTKRTGKLSFSMIIDHPDIVNKKRGEATHIWERYFRGDKSVQDEVDNLIANKLTEDEKIEINNLRNKTQPSSKKLNSVVTSNEKISKEIKTGQNLYDYVVENGERVLNIHFPNEVSELPDKNGGNIVNNAGYELNSNNLTPSDPLYYTFVNGVQKSSGADPYENEFNYSFNSDYNNNDILNIFRPIDSSGGKKIKYFTFGFASAAITDAITNNTLGENRASSTLNYLKGIIGDIVNVEFNDAVGLSDTFDNLTVDGDRQDSIAAKDARRSEIWAIVLDDVNEDEPSDVDAIVDSFDNDSTNAQNAPDPDETATNPNENVGLSQDLYEKLFYNECDWFEEVKIIDPLVYDTISQNVKHFHPAYHSSTPSSFHKRLTFLNQCTRQGSSEVIIANRPNLSFGTQPLLKLMIGDFFYTYFIINNLSIDYSMDGGVSWDINPEGIGVMPMLCNVSMDIVILGSQSLSTPINRLNNALSFNYYANTKAYDQRANDVEFVYENDIDENGTTLETGEFKGKIIEGIKGKDLNADLGNQITNSLVKFRNITKEQLENSQITDSQLGDIASIDVRKMFNSRTV
jgi:hypothetical protein